MSYPKGLSIHEAFKDALEGKWPCSDQAVIDHCRIVIQRSPPGGLRDTFAKHLELNINQTGLAKEFRLWLDLVSDYQEL